jgi:putative ABC transport system permease protein
MTASWLYVLRNLGRRQTRTVIGALGIFLTLALLTAIEIGLDSVSTSYLDLVALQAGKADLVITGEGGDALSPTAFDPADARRRLEAHPLLRGVSPRFIGAVEVRNAGVEHHAILIGLDPRREQALDISGLVPEPALAGGTCALSKSLAAKFNATAASTLRVSSPMAGSDVALRFERVLERQLMLPQQVRDYIVVDEAAARSILGEPTRVHVLAGALRHPRDFYDARDLHASVLRLKQAGEAVAAELGLDYAVRLPKAAAITTFQDFTSPLRAVFGVFALLALTITGLLIYSLISVAVEERIREYAILRTLGARRNDIVRLVLAESLLLCFLGVAPGVLAGTVFARLIVRLVELAMKAGSQAITLEITPTTLWLTLAAGVALSLGAALAPALRAIRWRIVDALEPLRRGQVPVLPPSEGQAHRPLVFTGLALSALSVVVFFVLPTAFLSGNPSLIGTVVLCLLVSILLGFTLTMIGVLPFVERIVLGAFGWALGPAAELAGRNLQRHRRRNTTTALMFTLSVALVIFLASLGALASRTALAMVERTHGADLRIHTAQAGTESLKSELKRLHGVKAVSEVRYLRSRSEFGIAYDVIVSDLVGMKSLWIVPFGADPDLARVLYTNLVAYDAGGPLALAQLTNRVTAAEAGTVRTSPPPPLVLSQAAAKFLDVTAGDQVLLSFRLGAERSDARFRVAAVCATVPGFDNVRARVAYAVGSGAIIPLENFNALTRAVPPEAFQALYFVKTARDTATQTAVARSIRDDFDVRYRFGVQSTAEQKQEARALYWATQVFFGLMLAVAVVIAVFALIASMASAVIERRWEIGMLKALGLRRGQLFRMFFAEAVGITLSAGVTGGAIGFGLAWLFMLQAAVLMELRPIFTMPYLTFLATFAISIIAGALAAQLPTRRLLRRPAAEILRLEG